MRERRMRPLSMTVGELITALGETHPMVANVAKMGLNRVVTVDKDRYEEAVVKRELIPETPPGETEDA